MHRHQCKETSVIKKQVNMTKKTNKAMITDHKEMEIYKMPKFRIILFKKFNELQNTQMDN